MIKNQPMSLQLLLIDMKNLDVQKRGDSIEESHPDPQPNINHLKRRQSSIRREIIVEGEFCELRNNSSREC